MRRDSLAIGAMGGALVLSNLVALLLAAPLLGAGVQAFPHPNDPSNAIIYFLFILGFTGIILLMIKLGVEKLVKFAVLGSMAFTMLFIFSLTMTLALVAVVDPDTAGLVGFFGSIPLAGGLTYALYRFPEWYVVDAVGLAVAAGVTAIIGISFGILPALILLTILALYDAISVYKTKHMITLADAVGGLRLPILLVVPKHRRYSFRQAPRIKEQLEKGEEREAMFMGLGDIIVPGILVVSAFANLPDQATLNPLGLGANLVVALVTLLGALVGFGALMRFVLKGNPQAGLPLLNGGAIAGYVLAYLLLFQDLGFGIHL